MDVLAASDVQKEDQAEGRPIENDEGQAQERAESSRTLPRPSVEENTPSALPAPPNASGRFGGLRRLVSSSSKMFVSDNDDDDNDDDEATQKTSGYLSVSASEVSDLWGSLFDNHRGERSDNDGGHRRSSSSKMGMSAPIQKKQPNNNNNNNKCSVGKRTKSDCTDILEVDDEDVDFVVSLKVLLAEAKSDADAASVQNATLVKEAVRLEHCLEATTSRIEELEAELQYQRNLAATTTRIASRLEASNILLKRQLTAARKEIGTRRAAGAAAAPNQGLASDAGANLELSVMKRRVEDLERQNRMLRSELVGAGHELDEHHRQQQQSLTSLDAAAAAAAAAAPAEEVDYPDEISSMISNEEQRMRSHREEGSNSTNSGLLFEVDGDLCGTIDCS